MDSPTQTQTFRVPQPPIRLKAVLFGTVVSVVVVLAAALRVGPWDTIDVLDVLCILAVVWVMALTENQLVYWAYKRGRRLHVGPEGICFEDGGSRQLLPWDAVTRVEIRAESGIAVGMDVYSAEGKEFDLEEFERLPEIVTLVRAGVPPSVPVGHGGGTAGGS
jgi:hypothetical protein